MAKVTITLTDESNENGGTVHIKLEAEPPFQDGVCTPAQEMAFEMFKSVRRAFHEESEQETDNG